MWICHVSGGIDDTMIVTGLGKERCVFSRMAGRFGLTTRGSASIQVSCCILLKGLTWHHQTGMYFPFLSSHEEDETPGHSHHSDSFLLVVYHTAEDRNPRKECAELQPWRSQPSFFWSLPPTPPPTPPTPLPTVSAFTHDLIVTVNDEGVKAVRAWMKAKLLVVTASKFRSQCLPQSLRTFL